MKKCRRSPRFYLLLSLIYLVNAVIWIWLGLIPRDYSGLKLVIGILWFIGAVMGFSKYLKMRQYNQTHSADIRGR